MSRRMPFALFWLCALASAQEAPKVISLQPAHLAEVDAKTTTQLVVTFDQAMSDLGFSICGGGPQFPTVKGRPRWQDPKTLVVDVELVPDHQYQMSLNCPAARGFRSALGVELVPVPWSFSTLPLQLRPAAEQKRRNERALKILMKTLAERYSYYDLRIDDWSQLERRHRDAVLAARTDRGFAVAAAEMLKPTEDLHLYLRIGDQTFGTGSRAVDPLFREQLLGKYLRHEPVGKQVLAGRTEDGIGYLLIAAWSGDVDPEMVGFAITAMADTKAMVIDVRPNSGGDEGIAQQVAGWFVEGEQVYARNRSRERAGKNGFGSTLDRTIAGHGENRHYDKPIAVLTSRYVMSSNEAFVLMMRKAKRCVVVGQPTFGSSGNPKPFELGNGVTVFVPSWQSLRPDGTAFEGEGLAPDEFVPCTADDLTARDPILERALELLRNQIARGK